MSQSSHILATDPTRIMGGASPVQAAAPGSAIQLLHPAPLRLQVFSDLHVDYSQMHPVTPAAGIDAIIVAGDVCEGAQRAYEHLRTIFPLAMPIVMVLGNHEFYRGFGPEVLEEARSLAPAYNVGFLEDEATAIAGVRFLGCTLWTDYLLNPRYSQAAAMAVARHSLNDHRLIGWQKDPWARFRPQDALQLHLASRAFLDNALRQPHPGPTIVVTHHAPHPGSVDPRYVRDPLTPAYVSDLSDLITDHQPALWVHGHVHTSCDYEVGSTRIVCNPHGYGRENPDFNPALVVEIAR